MIDNQTSYERGAQCFPEPFRQRLFSVPAAEQSETEEIRLRAGKGMSLLKCTGEEVFFSDTKKATQQDLRNTVEIATRASFHTAMDKLCRGYFPLSGGNRLGIAGTAVVLNGRIHHFQALSSLSLRLAHELPGVAEPLVQQLEEKGLTGASILILAPPGGGKTTLLRDLIRIYSEKWHFRVGVADERGEIAALHDGVPQFDIGPSVDVVEGCNKGEAGLLLLRSMNPQVIAMDEITEPEDGAAISILSNCGTAVIATAHGAEVDALERRPAYRSLLGQQIFQAVIRIERQGRERRYQLEEFPCCD